MKKKILIAHATYGSGHKMVAEYLYDYFQKHNYKDTFEIYLIDILDYGNKLGDFSVKLFNKNFEYRSNAIFNAVYEFFDHRITTLPYKFITRTLFSKELEDYIVELDPDVLISSHFFASIMMEIINQKYEMKTKIVTILTDYISHQMWIKNKNKSSAYIVSNEIVKQQLINDGIKKEKVYSYGIPLSSKFKNVSCNPIEVKELYNIDNDKPVYLFFAGGTYGSSFSYDYLKKILELRLDVNIIFVSGKNEKLKTRVEYLVKNRGYKNITVLGYTTDVSRLMYIADLVISKPGGLNLTESLEMKCPLLLIPGNGGQENYNAKFVKRNGFGVYCNHPLKAKRALKKLYEKPQILSKYKYNLLHYQENNATEKIYKLVMKLLKEKGI